MTRTVRPTSVDAADRLPDSLADILRAVDAKIRRCGPWSRNDRAHR